MTLAINFTLFIISAVFLVLSGAYLVKSLSKISQFLRITEFAAAFILISIATSFPELFVGISSALTGQTALALGNVLGANLIDLTLIMGILILLGKGIKTKHTQLRESPYLLVGIVALPLVLFFFGNMLSRVDGLLLLLVFFAYSYRLIKNSKKYAKGYKVHKKKLEGIGIILTTLILIISLAVLIASSYFVIKYASLISINLQLPQILVGLFIISLGTTLPELAFGVRAVLSGHKSMGIGDQLGTIIVNSTLVLGVTSLITPITANIFLFFTAGIFLLFSAFLFVYFVTSKGKLSSTEGVILILIYVLFIIVQFYLGRVMI